MASIKDYAKMFEWQLVAFSLFTGIIGLYFCLINLFGFIKIEVMLMIFIGSFLIKCSVGGLVSAYVDSDKIKIMYAYFIVVQIVITLVLLISSGIKIQPDKEFKIDLHNKYVKKDLKYLDPLHQTMKCCDMKPINLLFSLNYSEKVVLIDSCCPVLDSNGQCVPKLAYKDKCDDVYDKKVYRYRTTTIILLILVIISQVLMFYSFYTSVN